MVKAATMMCCMVQATAGMCRPVTEDMYIQTLDSTKAWECWVNLRFHHLQGQRKVKQQRYYDWHLQCILDVLM